jgi:hypothetical protein
MYPNTQPFPTERLNETNNFVASVVKENVSLWVECPGANAIKLFAHNLRIFTIRWQAFPAFSNVCE